MKEQTIGYCYVVGDILHKGHLLHLKNCKSLCDFLICGVLSDKACMEKKPEPIMPLDERLELVASLKMIDMAVCQEEYSPLANCKALKPDILFESISHKEMPANNYMNSINGKVVVMPYFSGQSSSSIKRKIKESTKNEKNN